MGELQFFIRNATILDLDSIARLEKEIEGEWAASKERIEGRIKMFPEGFFVAESDG